MKFELTFESQQLSKEEVRLLVQAIRDCEQTSFPDKEIFIWIEVPELSMAECNEILASIKPPTSTGQSSSRERGRVVVTQWLHEPFTQVRILPPPPGIIRKAN